jgi:hypothetical protein
MEYLSFEARTQTELSPGHTTFDNIRVRKDQNDLKKRGMSRRKIQHWQRNGGHVGQGY